MKSEGQTQAALSAAENALLSDDLDFNHKAAILSDMLQSSQGEAAAKLESLTVAVADQYPEEAKAQALAGDIFYQMDQSSKALDYYVRSVALEPGNFVVWQNILSIASDLGLHNKQEEYAEQALTFFPNQAALYYLGAQAKYYLQKYREAVQLLEAGKLYAVQEDLQSVFNSQLGDAYHALKEYEASFRAYEEALTINPDNEHALNNFSFYLAEQGLRLDEALTHSTRLIDLQPDNANYLDTHGWVLYQKGDIKEAVKVLKKAASMQPTANILEHYGDALFRSGKKEEAIIQWEKALSKDQGNERLKKKIEDERLYE
jgi:tetratricopeptide (TPR) repeat protein